jgi:hypothetical protein
MKRIRLKNLLSLTEQAPQPPADMAPTGGEAPAGAPPAPGAETPEAPAPETPSPETPAPESPSEYDFTKDFREFEDTKNKAEAEAKKKLLDQMNKMILNKKITANASRGYGQPKTDHTIENVKKVSVEFWYKDYVVIVEDENDKKYFLTPGVNIKIEGSASEPAPEGEPGQAPAGAEVPPTPGTPEAPPAEMPPVPPAGGAPADPTQPEVPAAPAAVPAAPVPAPQPPVPAPEEDPRKKKAVAESVNYRWVQSDVGSILSEFVIDRAKNVNGVFNVKKFLTSFIVKEETDTTSKVSYTLEIPSILFEHFDHRDLMLEVNSGLRANSARRQKVTGNVDIQKVGRNYLFTFEKTITWK